MAIEQEVQEYLEGRRERLTYNYEWAQKAGVGLHIINRHVIPGLNPQLQEQRARILNSQTARDRNEEYGNPSIKRQ